MYVLEIDSLKVNIFNVFFLRRYDLRHKYEYNTDTPGIRNQDLLDWYHIIVVDVGGCGGGKCAHLSGKLKTYHDVEQLMRLIHSNLRSYMWFFF